MPLSESVRILSLDDLDGLAEIVGDARVAIGENNHYVREFALLRSRIVRFMVTELDFGVLAVESGFAEGQLVDDWVRGGPGDIETVARDGFTFRFGEPPEVQDMLAWLRAHDATGGRVRFAGTDVPGSGGSGLPALRRMRDHLAAHVPAELPLVDAVVEATRPYVADNNAVATARYATLSDAARDAATAALTRLVLRLDAIRPDLGREGHLIARHLALGALCLDEHLRELVDLGRPDPAPLVVSSRDVYQAETVHLLRELHGRDERIVLLTHNAHLQRTPMELIPGVWARTTGSYLSAELGDQYVALAVTALTGSTADVRLDERAPHGFEIVTHPLDPPAAGSIEHSLGRPALLDLRPARGTPGPGTIRHVTGYAAVDVLSAFDALACLPSTNPSAIARPAR